MNKQRQQHIPIPSTLPPPQIHAPLSGTKAERVVEMLNCGSSWNSDLVAVGVGAVSFCQRYM